MGNFFEKIKGKYSISITNGGVIEFIKLNEHIFSFLVFSTAVTTLLLGWITVKIYLSTYFTTHENNLNNQDVNRYSTYLKHYDNFLMMIDIKINKLKYLSGTNIDKLCLYNFIFPNIKDGVLVVSNDYVELINSLDQSIEFLNKNLPRKIGYSDHIEFLINQANKIGVELPYYERKYFLKIEHELYSLINHINYNIRVKELTEPKYSIY
ncbi:hypothetical protein AV645_03175 [Acinetobacter calcoaceticus]|nr:retron Ec48 family effector membrane protein [Acinetobacter calcoaceticus]KUM12157.1 hypothetical protein AV645_03175 [Acinetobacter calcoaceticus]